MDNPKHTQADGRRVFFYRATLPPLLALLLVARLLFVFLSVAAVALAGGTIAALFLPRLWRGRRLHTRRDTDCITLERDQYSRVESGPQSPAPDPST